MDCHSWQLPDQDHHRSRSRKCGTYVLRGKPLFPRHRLASELAPRCSSLETIASVDDGCRISPAWTVFEWFCKSPCATFGLDNSINEEPAAPTNCGNLSQICNTTSQKLFGKGQNREELDWSPVGPLIGFSTQKCEITYFH